MAGSAGGPFVGVYSGSSGAANASAALKPLLPNISVYDQGSNNMIPLQNQITTPTQTASSGGNLAKFGHFLGDLAGETGHLAAGATDWLAHNAVNLAESPIKLIGGIDSGINDRLSLDSLQQRNQQIGSRLDTLHTQFKAGAINAKQYQDGLKSLTKDSTDLVKQGESLSNKVSIDQKASTAALVNTASALITVMTAGLGGLGEATAAKLAESGITLDPIATKSAADWLTSKVADPILAPVSDTISRIASNPDVFKSLDAATQEALQRSTAEVVAQSANLTAPQIARATAANIALKYPIYFNYLSSTAQNVYTELDQGKYGDAIRTLAFNAALVISGGPIGQSIKAAGGILRGAGKLTFGEGSFWDETAKFVGDGSETKTDGFSKAIPKVIRELPESERQRAIQVLSNHEATNMAAVGGNEVKAAARVAAGVQGEYAYSLHSLSHEDYIRNALNFSDLQERFDTEAKAKGLAQTTLGRGDARNKATIAEAITSKPKDQWAQAWNDWKVSNPNLAEANNDSLNRQMNTIMGNSETGDELKSSIMGIKMETTAEGFSKKLVDEAATKGFYPIQPKNIAAPFKEGTGILKSGNIRPGFVDEDFFTKTVQPLPVLESVGQLLTGLGLSPQASTQRVYQMFTDNVARNLAGTGAVKGIEATKDLTSTDLALKKLSSFAKSLKVPVQDMRMLTNKQIRNALGVGFGDAAEVQKAISKAYIDIPMSIRGLGDSAVDWSYHLPGTSEVMRRYLRIQGALRFSFNPFFQYLRVIPKTEILTSAEGGGFINSIFQGRAGAISDIRTTLRDGGFLDQPGHLGNVVSGEAIEGTGATGSNLAKKLLPMQERSISGLIDSQAQRMGMDAKDYIAQYPEHVRNTVQAIAEYDKQGNFINSPMAKTLNIAIFPFRFDTKVATILTKSLARQPLLTQVAFVNGLMKAHTWLNSAEGQAWYSQNSEAIAVLGYVSPVLSLSDAFMSLFPGHDHSLGNFGELGGLPFGWIPQLTDSAGLTHFNQSGTDPKTGDAIPKYVPATTKGAAATAIQDLLGELFSYPGEEVGLPSKASLTRSAALGLTGASKTTDLKLQTQSLSPSEQQYQKNVGGTPPSNAPNYQAAPTGTFSSPTPNANEDDLISQLKAHSAKAKAKTKAQFTPQLAPGQTAFGQV